MQDLTVQNLNVQVGPWLHDVQYVHQCRNSWHTESLKAFSSTQSGTSCFTGFIDAR